MEGTAVSPRVTIEMLCEGPECKATLNQNIVAALRSVDRLGSLNAATKELHMGYSNTLYSICHVEEALGIKVLERVCPKGSVLTQEGRKLIELFDEVSDSTQKYAERMTREAEVC